MILVDKFRIFVLVVGLCGTLFHTPHAQTLMCADTRGVNTCEDDAKKPYCGVYIGEASPSGCVSSSACPDTVTDEISCQDGKTRCCCKATTSDKPCNDMINDPAIREQACKIPQLSKGVGCGPQINCNGDTDQPLDKKCDSGLLCGAHKDGTVMGCVHPGTCPSTVTSQITCDDSKEFCCCNIDNCNTKAGVCAASKACTASPAPTGGPSGPTDTNTNANTDAPPGGGSADRPATILSVVFLVTFTSVTGFRFSFV